MVLGQERCLIPNPLQIPASSLGRRSTLGADTTSKRLRVILTEEEAEAASRVGSKPS